MAELYERFNLHSEEECFHVFLQMASCPAGESCRAVWVVKQSLKETDLGL